ncbi:MAG: hypothetical protein AAB969_00640 [Patescibacteria group bacterium]
MIIKRRKVPASGVSGYYLVYFLEENGKEIELGRTTWNDVAGLLGATNTYEEGLLAGLGFFAGKSLRLIIE